MMPQSGSKRTPIIHILCISILMLMSSCVGGIHTPVIPSKSITRTPTVDHINTPSRQLLTSTPKPTPDLSATRNLTLAPGQSVQDLVAIIEVSDPQSRTYDPHAIPYNQFQDAIRQLAQIGSSSEIDIPSMLAYSINFAHPDPFPEAQDLIALGPQNAATTLANLFGETQSPRSDVRLAVTLVMGVIGPEASCTVGQIGPLLNDPDPQVRSAAAWAVNRITKQDLAGTMGEISTNPLIISSVPADLPEGSLTGAARKWWTSQGSKVNWHPHYDICDP